MSKKEIKFEKIKLEDIIPYVNNQKKHPEEQIVKIIKGLEEIGIKKNDWAFVKVNPNYIVTKNGDVIRICREQKSKSGNLIKKYEIRILKGSIDRYGYKTVRMLVGGKKKHLKVHRLVAEAFIPNPENKKEINHKDGNKLNNKVDNLEWVTRAENNKHALETGLLGKGNNSKLTKIFTWDYVTIYIMKYEMGYKTKEIAKMFNVSKSTIERVLKRTKKVLFLVNEVLKNKERILYG